MPIKRSWTLNILLVFVFGLVFIFQPVHCSKRADVVVTGTTVPPGFNRISGECGAIFDFLWRLYFKNNTLLCISVAPPCPESHPFPYNDYKHCCSGKSRKADQCEGKTGFLLGEDQIGCCNDVEKLKCQGAPPCKMHEKGYERQSKKKKT